MAASKVALISKPSIDSCGRCPNRPCAPPDILSNRAFNLDTDDLLGFVKDTCKVLQGPPALCLQSLMVMSSRISNGSRQGMEFLHSEDPPVIHAGEGSAVRAIPRAAKGSFRQEPNLLGSAHI